MIAHRFITLFPPQRSKRAIALLLILFLRCNGFSTANLLDLDFLGSENSLSIETESLVNSGKTFVVHVTARKGNTTVPDVKFNGPLSATASGTGTLSIISVEPWSQGKTRMSVSYATTVGVGSLDSIVLQVTTSGGSVKASSGKISVYNQPSLHHFDVTIPASSQINTSFNVTITAKDVNGATLTSFSTPNDAGVLITPSSASGTLTVTSPASGFVNGVLTISASYNVAVYALRVRVALQSDAAIKGESGPLNIQTAAQATLANFRVMAIPVTSTQIRLTWTKIPEAFDVIVDEELTPGNFTQVATFSGSLNYHYRTVTASTSHTYRVTVRNNAAATLLQGTASATTYGASCATTIGATTYTTDQSWTIAASPYCINGSVVFDTGARLDIERGALILMSTAGKLTFRNGATFLPADAGSGMTRITSSSTLSPPAAHLGIVLEATATATAFQAGTDDYASGSVLRHIYFEYGGGFGSSVDLKVDDVFFRQNTAGAISISTAIKSLVSNATFQNNSISGSGGAISFGGSNGTVDSIYAEYNTATGAGGAIFRAKLVNNSFFLGNNAGTNGGATDSSKASNSVFIKNYSAGDGGAVSQCIPGGCARGVSSSYFYSNEAGGSGGAVYTPGDGDVIMYSYFEQNISGADGGAVFLNFAGNAKAPKRMGYNYYRANAATGSGSALYVDTSNAVGNAVSLTSQQEYYQDNATGTAALYVRQNRDATDTDNDTATISQSVFKKSTTDIESGANLAFVLTGNPTPVGVSNGTINNSYFESGAADCTAAFITGATSSCATPTPNLFKTDSAWPFCATTAPGQATPTNCVGPNWDKPSP